MIIYYECSGCNFDQREITTTDVLKSAQAQFLSVNCGPFPIAGEAHCSKGHLIMVVDLCAVGD